MLAVSRVSGTLRIFHILPGHAVVIEGLKVSGGFTPESGGGVFNDQAVLILNRCAVEGNYSSGFGGGGIYSSGGSARLTILNSTVSGNLNSGIAFGNGGAGAGINSTGALTITNSSVNGNSVTAQPPKPGVAGGIYSSGPLEITNSTIAGNTGGYVGGGIVCSGTTTITNSTVCCNTSIVVAGGISNSGPLTITNSTISGNTAVFKDSGFGGGIVNSGPLKIINSTVSGNVADRSGGISSGGDNAVLEIANSTFSGNRADTEAGGISNAGTMLIENTILNAGASGPNILNTGTATSHGYNMSSDDGGGVLTATGDQINTNPMLGPLQDNGGPTATYELLAGSPAIDAGDPTFTPPPLYDQRGPGYDRVFNGRIDIGSFEVQPAPPTPTPIPCASPATGPSEDFDGVTPPALPTGWTATNAAGPTLLWVTSNAGNPTPSADTAPNAAFVDDPDVVSDKRLDSPALAMFGTDAQLTFRHNFNFQSGFDGGVLEISIHDGTFQDVVSAGGSFITGGYNTTISAGSGSPIAGRQAWSGNSMGFVTTTVKLPSNTDFDFFRLRWRMGSDSSVSGPGWRVDTISFEYCPKPVLSTPTPVPVTPTPTPTIGPSPTPTIEPSPTPTPPATPTPTIGPATPAQALNISTRLRVETGDGIAIGGFIITGNAPKKVAIRGIGPSLGGSGLSDLLADPILELRDSNSAFVMQNDNWQDDPAQAAQLTALGLALQNSNESGIVATLQPGAYTAIMAGKNQTSGLGLVEIYDVDAAAASQLANISTRGFVRTADNVMIGGFILGNGSASVNVAMRGIGPSLSQSGLIDVLADPTLELHDSNGALLIANDNWQDDPVSAAQLTAHGLAPPNSLESGIFTALPPGLFTAILAGKNGGVGLGLVEIYSGVGGSTLTVTNTADSGAGSLRAAIAAASNGDTIQFDAALNGQTINLTSGELVIDKNITIAGPGPSLLAVSRDSNSMATFRIFHVTPGHTSTIEGLTISGNHANPPGGGVFNEATLTINNCRLDHNFSEGNGGGILNGGTLTIRNSSVSGSAAGALPLSTTGNGGGISNSGTLDISKSAIFGNEANFWGGGISNSGTVTITDCTVRGNLTGSEFVLGSGFGGGISNQDSGTLTIRNSTVSGNVSNGNSSGGGGIFSGSGNTTLVITNSTISGNFAHPKGGGILNGGSLTVTNSTVSGNSILSPGNGGAIHNNGGMVQIGNTILQTGAPGVNIFNNAGTITSHGYNLSSDNGGGFLTAIGDQINTDPILGPLQDNGGPTFTHELLTGSPAINAGDPSFTPPPLYDQRGPGYDRVVGGRIDIGSFEVQQ